MDRIIWLAGIGQLILVVASLAIPRVLEWKQDTSTLKPLTRQVFWTYAGYIWCTNLSFALVSICIPGSLIDGSSLAIAVSLFIAIYWGARILIQFFYFDRSDAPKGIIFLTGEVLLVGLFISLTGVYSYAAYLNLTS